MNISTEDRLDFPNLLMIAGNGRNVGKTWLACQIIKKLAKNHKITGIKISSHYHKDDAGENIIIENERFIISFEQKINSKDSSLMLQAGAEKVYFIMAPQQHLQEAFSFLKNDLKNEIIVCESGGLIEHVLPGIFLFVNRKGQQIQKPHLLQYSPLMVENDGNEIDFDINRITIEENKFTLK